LDELLALLTDKDHHVRRDAVEMIGTIGPDAKRATEQLGFVKQNDEQYIVRREAGMALVKVNQDQQ
jgi:HEAT repeat protein